ncbi:GNAT family N-acetyltransferase [Hymenobacter lutimineralis]|uniref:GNAT family N-acetyltransferase n=1 Tax=Hymenobacter lutimineralis TaxID=2606448 RepID=UPI0021CCA55D|nr:N-acetyltransferase [Hymenobacter lutimineralis]
MLITFRPSRLQDAAAIKSLYQQVSGESGGLARQPEEITDEYVLNFLTRSLQRGVALVAEQNGQLVAEIHTYSPGLQIFAHVFGDLTVAVAPAAQGQGVGRKLFTALLTAVQTQFPGVQRVELLVRESNTRAIALYEQLGFHQEGRFLGRVATTQGVEADIPMAWYAPSTSTAPSES